MESLDVMDIKQHNVKSIVNVLRFSAGESGLTKRDIADRTALSFATVSNLCNELLERGIVEIVKKNSMSVGRTPSTVNLAYNRFCTVCLNLQMKNTIYPVWMRLKKSLILPGSGLMRLQGKTPIACTSVWGWLFQESLIWLPRHL